jgi:hypothetical protein
MKLGYEILSFLNWYILFSSWWNLVMKFCPSWIDTYFFLVDETCSMWVVVMKICHSWIHSYIHTSNWQNLVMKLSFLNSITHTSNWWNLVMKILSFLNSYMLLQGWRNLFRVFVCVCVSGQCKFVMPEFIHTSSWQLIPYLSKSQWQDNAISYLKKDENECQPKTWSLYPDGLVVVVVVVLVDRTLKSTQQVSLKLKRVEKKKGPCTTAMPFPIESWQREHYCKETNLGPTQKCNKLLANLKDKKKKHMS